MEEIGARVDSGEPNRDGECNEGSIWEAAMSAPNFDLENLTVIVDHNKFQQTGSNDEIMKLRNLKDLFFFLNSSNFF